MNIRKKCKDCGEWFVIDENEQEYIKSKNYKMPKRCKVCRVEFRKQNEFFDREEELDFFEETLEKEIRKNQKKKYKKENKPLNHLVENLFIIGNGFDAWQALPTSYNDFKEFYSKNKLQFCKDLDIECINFSNYNGEIESITPFDLIYLYLSDSCFDKNENFWNSFENSLGLIDDENINYNFGKEHDEVLALRMTTILAYNLIIYSFCKWIKSINISDNLSEYNFINSIFINFNYTDTLEKRFNVNKNDIIHIHGRAEDELSVVVGHGEKMAKPELFIALFGQRFKELYILSKMLYKFYKKPFIHWNNLLERLKNKQTDFTNVKNIYILGHSLSKVDMYYFKKLRKIIDDNVEWHISYYRDEDYKNALDFVKKLDINNYKLYGSIDEAIKKFKKTKT